MADRPIPESWIGSEVELFPQNGTGASIKGTLYDVSSAGITISSPDRHVEGQGMVKDENFYPWSSFLRMTKR